MHDMIFNFPPFTAKNTVISPNYLVWKFCRKAQFQYSFGQIAKLCGNCAFPQNFHTRKLGEIMVFYAVCRNASPTEATIPDKIFGAK